VIETEPIVSFRLRDAGPQPEYCEARSNSPTPRVAFERKELNQILAVYGTKVAAGEWRDYALDFGPDSATFAVYRRSCEMPLYRIVKNPKLARRQGQYAVVAPGNHILKRGHDLAQVLRVFFGKPTLVTP
jgi:hypothetical protein